MIKIKDTIALGWIAGILGSIPQFAINILSVQLGFSRYYSFQISSGIYLPQKLTMTLPGIMLGVMTWITSSAILGILIALIIKFTGKEYWYLKGLTVTNGLMYTIIYGLLYSLGASRVTPWDTATNIGIFIENAILGLTTSYLIIKWAN